MRLLHAKRLLKLADEVEFDGDQFDYKDLCLCACPRVERLFNRCVVGSNGDEEAFKLFGIDSEERGFLFNLRSMERLNRNEVAQRFRTFVMQKLGVVRPKVRVKTEPCPVCSGSGKVEIIHKEGVRCHA